MIHKTTRRRLAALTSGAVAGLGLVVVPAAVGLSTASAAPATIDYTCAGAAAGQSFSLPSVANIEATGPASVASGSAFDSDLSIKLDMGSASFGPVTGLTGTWDVPLTVGGASKTFTTKSQTIPMTALVVNDAGKLGLTAPAAVGDAPITVGTIVGHVVADPFGLALTVTCTPNAGEDLTVGKVTVAGGGEPEALKYTCVVNGGPTPLSLPSTVDLEITPPATATAGQPFEAPVDITVDMGSVMFGPVDGFTGDLDLDFLVGDQASVGTVPIDPVTLTPNVAGPVVLHGAGVVELLAPAKTGPADIDIAYVVRKLQASVFGSSVANNGDCTPDAGQDLTVGSVDVTAPKAVAVTGAVKITGTPKVGKTLKAVPGKADGATVTYQWLSNGKAIKGATKSSLKLSKALKGKKVSVKATYGKDGFTPAVQTSKAVTVKK